MTQPAPAPSKPAQQPATTTILIQSTWHYSEQALLGCILQSGAVGKGRQTFAEAVDSTGIRFSDFISRELSALWYVMDLLYQGGNEIELSTIWAEVQKSDKAQKLITMEVLAYLSNQKVGGHRTHANNIVDASISRSAEDALNKLTPIVKNPKIPSAEKIRRISRVATELSERTDHASKSHTVSVTSGLSDFIQSYHTQQESGDVNFGITTGFPALDDKIDGWRDSTLHVIAGAPGSGKTVFLFTSALHAVMAGKRVLVVQLELPVDQSYRRMLSAFAGIDSKRFKRNQLTQWELSRLPKAVSKLKEFDQDNRFTLLTMNRPTLEEIKIKLDTLMMKGYDIIFFDYAGAARIAPDRPMSDLDLHQQIYTTVDSWKKTYNVPVVTGAQYGNEFQPKHPGAYTQDMIYSSSFFKHNADSMTFLHRNKVEGNNAPSTSLVMVKNRDGESNSGANTIITVRAEMNMFRFIPQGVNSTGMPQPLWTIHEDNKPHAVDLGDL